MSFQIGDEVVCVTAILPPGLMLVDGPPAVPGNHYVVSDVGSWVLIPGGWVKLKECGPLHRYSEVRFRKVKKEEIELFRQMAASPKPLIPV